MNRNNSRPLLALAIGTIDYNFVDQRIIRNYVCPLGRVVHKDSLIHIGHYCDPLYGSDPLPDFGQLGGTLLEPTPADISRILISTRITLTHQKVNRYHLNKGKDEFHMR